MVCHSFSILTNFPISTGSVRLALAFSLLVLMPRSVQAQVYECDGKWTNQECHGQINAELEETNKVLDVNDRLTREKRSLLQELRMELLSAREDYGIQFDIKAVEVICGDATASLEDCQEKVNEAQGLLSEAIKESVALNLQKKSLELQEEANRLQRERNEIEANKPSVLVEQHDHVNELIIQQSDTQGNNSVEITNPPGPSGAPKNTPIFTPGPFAPKRQ